MMMPGVLTPGFKDNEFLVFASKRLALT